jgi:hypothetical protein
VHNGGSVLLAFLNLYVRIKVHVATFDTNLAVTDSNPIQSINQSIVASMQKLPDSVVKSAELAVGSRCVRRNDQVIDQFEFSR